MSGVDASGVIEALLAIVGTLALGLGGWALSSSHSNSVEIGMLKQRNADDEWLGDKVSEMSTTLAVHGQKLEHVNQTTTDTQKLVKELEAHVLDLRVKQKQP